MGQLLFQMSIGFILLLCWLIGFGMTAQLCEDLRTAISSRKWNRLEANVTGHKVYTYKTGGDKISRTVYGYLVMYTYSIDHQTYQGSGFDRGNFVAWEYAERASAEDYPVGKEVQILYSPDEPEISSSRDSSEWMISEAVKLVFGVAFMMVMTGLVILASDYFGTAALSLKIGTGLVLTLFWCWMLFNILYIISIAFGGVKNRGLPRPLVSGVGFFIILFLLSMLSTLLIGSLVNIIRANIIALPELLGYSQTLAGKHLSVSNVLN